jgi:branched-chain amino acid aminotransferase
MATQVEGVAVRLSPAEVLERIACSTSVFISMPCVYGITPRVLIEKGSREELPPVGGRERYYGTFRLDEAGVPAFDHGLLYGDAVFEGVLVAEGRLFQWREHLERLYASAERLKIEVPYTPEELTRRILDAVNNTRAEDKGSPYLRLVVTRGIGDLGINPARCAGSTVYCVISRIQLYPESTYEQGIRLSLSKKVHRAGADVLNPQIKSCNYLNNITALVETLDEGTQETLMLTSQGFVAEATTDNIFVVVRNPGWKHDASKVTVTTPSAAYCLKGITRELVLGYARSMGFTIDESATINPEDLIGPHKEVFLTGTAAGVVPVVALDGQKVGDGMPGEITHKLRRQLFEDMTSAGKSLSLEATEEQMWDYLNSPHSGGHRSDPITSELITRLFETVDSRQWEGLKNFFCDEMIYERPGYDPLVGRERVEKFYREERVIASGKHLLDNIIVNESSGACWGRFVGVHKNGAALDERFADCYTFQDGKIKTRKSYFFRPAV